MVPERFTVRALVRRLAWTTPREGAWEAGLAAMRNEALAFLGAPA